MGQYDLGPARMAEMVGEWAEQGWLNIVGGCCGTTPEHIAAIASRISRLRAHQAADPPHWLRLSGTLPFTQRPDSNFIMVGELTNVTGSKAFARLIRDGKY